MKKSWTKSSHQILEQASDLNRYNRWIISLFKNHFGESILEIGSGLGGLSQFLPQANLTLSDIRSEYLNYLKKHFSQKILKLDIEKELPSPQSSFDTIISSNVFEHLQDDQKALNNCFKILKKNGKLLFFVPARPEIYGSLDKAMGHYRRYNKEKLAEEAKQAGFKILKIKYVNFPGYFTWWLRGRFSGKSNSDSALSKVFDYIVVPFLYLEKFLLPPFGQSLILIAQKP